MDSFPDLATLSDPELKDLIHDLERQENEVSYRRRILHGQIDILHAELVARLRGRVDAGESPISEADVGRLAEILAGKGPPRIEADDD